MTVEFGKRLSIQLEPWHELATQAYAPMDEILVDMAYRSMCDLLAALDFRDREICTFWLGEAVYDAVCGSLYRRAAASGLPLPLVGPTFYGAKIKCRPGLIDDSPYRIDLVAESEQDASLRRLARENGGTVHILKRCPSCNDTRYGL